MNLEHDLCYAAVQSRDRRFDGRFFTAVKTTGIYCRPICPARTPLSANVRFYPCAAAAESAGYRPCRRCRPESSPGSPAWDGTSVTVGRAVRLIEAGALDEASADELAGRLGVGERHLRRLFLEHLGVSPITLALTRRLHLARKLLDETALPVTEIAFAAGFNSLRRFNDAFAKAYHAPPTALRRDPATRTSGDRLALRLPWREPYDWEALLSFLRPRAMPGVEQIDGLRYRRSFRMGDTVGVLEVAPAADGRGVQLTLPASASRSVRAIVARVRQMFDLETPLETIAAALSRDPVLARAIERKPGLRLPGAWDPFDLAVRAILGQQVSVAAATTLAGRLVQSHGTPLEDAPEGGPTHLFPAPATLAGADLTKIGLPRKRAESLSGFARTVASGANPLDPRASLDELVASLTALPGIGDWTAQYIAMRGFAEPDAFPAGDLGLRKALAEGGTLPRERDVLARARSWQPFRAYAAIWLWNSLS